MSRRLLLVVLLAVCVFAARLVPSPAPARADVCSLPIVGAVCGLVGGVVDGVGYTVDRVTGSVSVGGKIIGKVVSGGGGLACDLLPAWTSKLCGPLMKIVGRAAGGGGGTPTTTTGAPTTTGGAPVDGASQVPADAPQNYLRTSALAAAAAVTMGSVSHLIGVATRADVGSSWFGGLYGRVVAASFALAGLMFLIALIQAVSHGDGVLLMAAVRAVPYAVLVCGSAVFCVTSAIAITDTMGSWVAGPALGSAKHVLDVLAVLFVALGLAAKGAASTGHATVAHLSGFLGVVFSMFGLLTGGLILLEMTLREIAIYATTLFLPLVYAARIWPALRHVAQGVLMLLLSAIVTKLVLVVMLALSAEAVLHGGVTGIIVGCVALLLTGIMPWLFYRLAGLVHHGASNMQVAGAAGGAGFAAGRMHDLIGHRSTEGG